MRTADFLQDCLCKRYLRGEDCSRRRCDHIHGTSLNDPTGIEVAKRSIFWNTTPDAITLEPYPPQPTQQELDRFPTSIYVPVPLPDICTNTYYLWDDSAYGLPPPPHLTQYNIRQQPYMPRLDQNRIQVAIELLSRTAATHRSLPLEASRILLTHIRSLVSMFTYNGRTRPTIFQNYEPESQETMNERTLRSKDDHRPTAEEFQGYILDWHRRAGDLMAKIDRVERTIQGRRLERRPAPPEPARPPPSGPLLSLPEHPANNGPEPEDPWNNPPRQQRPPDADSVPPNPWFNITAAPDTDNWR